MAADPVTVLLEMRVLASPTRRAALDVALAVLALVQRLAQADPYSLGTSPQVSQRVIAEARALLAQETTHG